MIGSLLQPLIEQGESARAEFKREIDKLEMVGQTVCAFLNAGGGTLVAGVTDNGRIVGIENAQKMAVRIRQDLAQYLSPQASYSVDVEEIDGKPCLIVDVPPGSQTPYVYRDNILAQTAYKAFARPALTFPACCSAGDWNRYAGSACLRSAPILRSWIRKRLPVPSRWNSRTIGAQAGRLFPLMTHCNC